MLLDPQNLCSLQWHADSDAFGLVILLQVTNHDMQVPKEFSTLDHS